MRAITDKEISKHSSPKDRLSCTAKIIVHPSFQSAVGKIQNGNEDPLTKEEKEYVSHLLKSPTRSELDPFIALHVAERVIKRRRYSKTSKFGVH